MNKEEEPLPKDELIFLEKFKAEMNEEILTEYKSSLSSVLEDCICDDEVKEFLADYTHKKKSPILFRKVNYLYAALIPIIISIGVLTVKHLNVESSDNDESKKLGKLIKKESTPPKIKDPSLELDAKAIHFSNSSNDSVIVSTFNNVEKLHIFEDK